MYGESGGSRRDRIVANAIAAVRRNFSAQLAEGDCRVWTGPWTFGGQGWTRELRADVTLIWKVPSPIPEAARLAIVVLDEAEPVPDLLLRLDLFRATQVLAHLLVAETARPRILSHANSSSGPWHGFSVFDRIEDAIWLHHLGAVIGLREFYFGIFPEAGSGFGT